MRLMLRHLGPTHTPTHPCLSPDPSLVPPTQAIGLYLLVPTVVYMVCGLVVANLADAAVTRGLASIEATRKGAQVCEQSLPRE